MPSIEMILLPLSFYGMLYLAHGVGYRRGKRDGAVEESLRRCMARKERGE
jgi:hypothetical protein